MKKVIGFGALLVLMVTTSVHAKQQQETPEEYRSRLKLQAMKGPERKTYHPVAKAVEQIADRLKPGMTILDIGAGLGDFAFEFARKLEGTGKVFATDVDPRMIAGMKETMEREGIKNVAPVKVDPAGLDPFYRSQSFDLVMASRVYHSIVDPVGFFKELKPSLKPGAKLYLIETRMDGDFSAQTFFAFEKTIERLQREGERSPYFQGLSPALKKLLLEQKGKPVSDELKAAVLQGMNGLLESRTLFGEVQKHYFEKSPARKRLGSEPTAYGKYALAFSRFWERQFAAADRQLAFWLVAKLEAAGSFDGEGALGASELQDLRVLNKMLIHAEFVPHIRENPQFRRQVNYFPFKQGLIRNLEKAGYSFVTELQYSPHFYFLEFTPQAK